jgi:two-component system nitrogen regulation response regulator NtrX
MPSVLIVDDEGNIRRMVGALLAGEGYDVFDAPDGRAGLTLARTQDPDIALVDLMMPGEFDGLGLLEQLRQAFPDMPVVMMSGRAALADAVRATRLGAFTFLEKPLTPESVLLALASALELRQARRTARSLREDLGYTAELVGNSPVMQAVRQLITQVGPTDARVLITGESGTGKELVAAALHASSPRRDLPFIRVNCAAIPRDLLESEMFGHERGAFTGATERRIGRFELAHTGTLFLDEVGDLGLEAQAKLLRAIEAREIERVGGGKPLRVDVRIIAATNKDLTRAVRDGSFREDLLFRLNVIPIELAPLRERPGDIPLLVQHFAERYRARTGHACCAWPPEVISVFEDYAWPGNVRELANIVERLTILYPGTSATADQLRRLLPDSVSTPTSVARIAAEQEGDTLMNLSESLDAFERTLITRALTSAAGNVAEAARRLQTDRPNLYRRMKRLGLGGSNDE